MSRENPKYPFKTMKPLETRLIKDAPKCFSQYVSNWGSVEGRRFTTKRVPIGVLLTRWQ